jgi:F-type H+-transporting ATPase subunit b
MLAAGLTDINIALSVYTAITFLLLLIILGKYAWGPILHMLEQREKTIKDSLEGAEKAKAEATAAAAESKAALERSRAETAELVRKNQAEVAAAKAELMAAAKKESEELLSAARKTIAEEQRQAVSEVRTLAVDLALAAAGQLIQSQMDQGQQKKLVEEYLAKLPRA